MRYTVHRGDVMDLNIRNVDGELVRGLKVEALTLGLTLRELCIRKLRGTVAQLAEQEPHKIQGAGSIPAGPTTPNISELKAICAGQVPDDDPPEPEDMMPTCCECDKPLRAKMYRGVAVAWACADPGCPMFGREKK
jgi:hypothetical protein